MKKPNLTKLGFSLVICGMLTLVAIPLAGCGDHRARHCFIIQIHEDYREKFDNREFTLADFEWGNIDAYAYSEIQDYWDYPFIYLRLKQAGIKHVNEAMEHMEKLSFVKYVGYVYADRWKSIDWIE